ncbi:MAG: protein disulfide-isomerase [Flavobacterium sp.]|jgi:protein disulfide-isomerase
MKKKIVLLFFLLGLTTTQAQETLTWHTNLDKAIAISNEESKPIFMFFTGSDWCGWCIRLQKEVFKTPEFEAWAKENVVLLELDFPRRTIQSDELRIQNGNLQQFFQVAGYPSIWITKAQTIDGKTSFEKIGMTGYLAGGPAPWLANADTILANFVPNPKPEIKNSSKKTKKKVAATN